jgi:hypothetical protein
VSFNTRANACQRVSPKWLCVQHRSVSTIRVSCLILKTRPTGKHFLGVEENIQVVRRFSLDLRSSLLHDQLSFDVGSRTGRKSCPELTSALAIRHALACVTGGGIERRSMLDEIRVHGGSDERVHPPNVGLLILVA